MEHIFGYLVEIKGLQQWYGKFDAIEFDPNLVEGENMQGFYIHHSKASSFYFQLV